MPSQRAGLVAFLCRPLSAVLYKHHSVNDSCEFRNSYTSQWNYYYIILHYYVTYIDSAIKMFGIGKIVLREMCTLIRTEICDSKVFFFFTLLQKVKINVLLNFLLNFYFFSASWKSIMVSPKILIRTTFFNIKNNRKCFWASSNF